jgi:hypothetical protein
MTPIESALYELIDKDDTEVSTNDLTNTVDIAIAAKAAAGEIQSVLLVASELGSGAVRANTGILFFFDADPNTAAGDTTMTAAERKTLLGQVAIASGDWDSDALGGSVIKIVAIPFHALTIIYAVFRNTGTAFNDGAGDDEELHLQIHYRRDE